MILSALLIAAWRVHQPVVTDPADIVELTGVALEQFAADYIECAGVVRGLAYVTFGSSLDEEVHAVVTDAADHMTVVAGYLLRNTIPADSVAQTVQLISDRIDPIAQAAYGDLRDAQAMGEVPFRARSEALMLRVRVCLATYGEATSAFDPLANEWLDGG